MMLAEMSALSRKKDMRIITGRRLLAMPSPTSCSQVEYLQIFVGQLMILQQSSAFRIFILRYRNCANFDFQVFLGVFFGQGSRPRMWASTPWAICRTDRLSTIDYPKFVVEPARASLGPKLVVDRR